MGVYLLNSQTLLLKFHVLGWWTCIYVFERQIIRSLVKLRVIIATAIFGLDICFLLLMVILYVQEIGYFVCNDQFYTGILLHTNKLKHLDT